VILVDASRSDTKVSNVCNKNPYSHHEESIQLIFIRAREPPLTPIDAMNAILLP
jgi:hypothetical protein